MKKFFQKVKQERDYVASTISSRPQKPEPGHSSLDLAQWTFDYFYSASNKQFQAQTKSESTLGENDHFGYVVWPVIIAVQAFSESLVEPRYQAAIKTSLSALQAYWNPEKNGFCAWKMFPGNNDIYYDDNGHAAQALISAYQATGDHKCLDQARCILTKLIMPAAEKDGGVPWHTNNQNCRNACSTGPAAVAALRIYKIKPDKILLRFAERALLWMVANLRDPEDHLIWDSFVIEADGKRNINKMKWTYNIGFAIHGFALLYSITRSQEHLNYSVDFAKAAMNRDGALFDRSNPGPKDRMYSDSSFFLHHLVDGYKALLGVAPHTDLGLREEIHAVAAWGRAWMFDNSDGLYFRGSCPYTVSEHLAHEFNTKYKMQKQFQRNGQEYDEQGNLCKTLIGNAGWIRILRMDEQTSTG